MSNSTFNQPNDQHTFIKSILMHVAPGVLATLAFLVIKPLLDPSGYPPLMAFLMAVLLIDIPFMLGVMLYEGKKLNGRLSLDGVVLHREKVSWKTLIWVFVVAFVVTFLLINLTIPLTSFLKENIFGFLPKWLDLEEQTQYEAYSRNILLVVFTLQLVITGVILPWVEELYFRGYLMPRISRYGKWAPLLGGLFFGLYHVWQLFGFFTVFLLGAVLSYLVWWKKDLRLSISLHVVANIIGRLMILLAAITM
ncbi:MAG: type II CAAX endopeptidase family protein [Anaerolineales bacterium]